MKPLPCRHAVVARDPHLMTALLISLFIGHGWSAPVASQAQPRPPAAADADSAATRVEPEMVLIPGGAFLMGKDGAGDAGPAHEVVIAPFYLDRTEVTNTEYHAFCRATGRRMPEFWSMEVYRSGIEYPDHPVVGVSWQDAVAYSRWRGARLPTEAEWECAARGGLAGKEYSHGDVLEDRLYAQTGYSGSAGPVRVASFPANGYGLHDMTGNVAEWVADRYDPACYRHSPRESPMGPSVGTLRVVRGGGWHTGPGCSTVHFRGALRSNWVDFNTGFRCARYKGESAALVMEEAFADSGLGGAIRRYWEMRTSPAGDFYFDQTEMNDMGYRLLGKGRTIEALEVLRLNADAYPESFNAQDSLGEAYLKLGQPESAIRHYRRALEINPDCATARDALDKMKVAP